MFATVTTGTLVCALAGLLNLLGILVAQFRLGVGLAELFGIRLHRYGRTSEHVVLS